MNLSYLIWLNYFVILNVIPKWYHFSITWLFHSSFLSFFSTPFLSNLTSFFSNYFSFRRSFISTLLLPSFFLPLSTYLPFISSTSLSFCRSYSFPPHQCNSRIRCLFMQNLSTSTARAWESESSGIIQLIDMRYSRYLWCIVLYCTVLWCTVQYCTVLYCTALWCTVLYCTVLCCAVLC